MVIGAWGLPSIGSFEFVGIFTRSFSEIFIGNMALGKFSLILFLFQKMATLINIPVNKIVAGKK